MALATRDKARLFPNEMGLADARGAISWSALDARLNRLANALIAFGFGAERRVAVFAPNAAEPVLAYLGSLHAGVSAVPVNSNLKAEELAYVLRESEAEILFVGPETLALGQAVAAELGTVEVIAWRCARQEGVTDWDAWLDGQSSEAPDERLAPRPYLQFTSGTTGFPKAIDAVDTTLPRASDTAEFFELLRQWSADRPTGAHLVLGPLYFNASLSSVRALAAGFPLVVAERFDPEAALALIETYRVVGSVMVPTHFKRLLALPAEVRAKYDVSSMQSLIHTGAACPPDVKRAMIDWFGPILTEAYGGTESGTTNFITSAEWLERPGSVGKTIDPFELLIYADDGALLGPNEAGQIFFRDKRGRGIVYRNDPEKTKAAHREPGVFTLGDVGYRDGDGYLYITDRVTDMIVSGGVNIYPAEIEHLLVAHPDILDAAVIGVPNPDLGEEAKALVIPADPSNPPLESALLDHLRARISTYKIPRSVEIVDDIGRNAAGKINKRALRAPYWPSDRTIG